MPVLTTMPLCMFISISLALAACSQYTEKPETSFKKNSTSKSNPNKTITLGYTKKSAGSIISKTSHIVFKEAFKRLGFEYSYKYYPAKRSSLMSDRGILDGEGSRVWAYGKDHSNMIRVNVSQISTTWASYAMNRNIKLTGWKSLEGNDYKVDYRRGIKFSRQRLFQVVKEDNLWGVNDIKHGLRRLIKGRTDIYIDVEVYVDMELKLEEFMNSGIYKISRMDETPLYCYLHKKHKLLVPKLSAVLREMREEGLMKKFRTIAEKK